MERPILDRGLKKEVFLTYYYLKEEPTAFCKENGLPASGSKGELTERVAEFLADNQGKTLKDAIKRRNYKKLKQGSHRYERTDLIALKE